MDGFEEKLKILKKMYPGPVIHKILVFGVPGKDALIGNKNIIPILSSKISTVTSMGTVMCDITTDFLAELAVLSIARQMGSFKSPGLKELELPVRSPSRSNSVAFRPRHALSRSGSGLASPTGSFSSVHGRLGTSKTGSISLGLTDKTKLRQKGRMLKYLAGMYLITGRWQDALRDFTEAAIALKGSHDHLWYGSALEGIGICLVLLSFLEVPVSIPPIALSSSHQPHTPDSSTDVLSPTSSHTSNNVLSAPPPMFEFLPELTNNILTSFARSQSSPEEGIPQIIYCETILRLANLLSITRMAGGWNPASLSAIVRGTSVIKNITPDSPSVYAISSWCSKAYGTDLRNMPVIAQASIYCGIAAIYSNIGLVRKRTFILRELLVSVAPKIMKTRANLAASNGVHSNSVSMDKQVMSLLGESSSNITEMLDTLSRVYGAGELTSVGFGWGELRVSFLKLSLSLCESLMDFVGIVHYAGLLLSTSADVLSSDDQLRLSGTIFRAIDSARTVGQGHVVSSYWDPNLLRDIKMVQTNTSILPQLTSKTTSTSGDVFIHNPFSNKRASADPQGSQNSKTDFILVQSERVECSIKLQNPFAFELHIYELTLLTENVEVKANARDIYIPARTIHEVSLPVVPLGVGNLRILGCRVHVAGCEPRDFHLVSKLDLLQNEKIKKIGAESAAGNNAEERDLASVKRNVDLNVISAQPVMVLNNLSLHQSWIMLLEGERQVFSFTVANISDVDINHFTLKFSDSTTQPLQNALSNKELPLNEIYEVEYFLFNRKALNWEKPDDDDGLIPRHKTKSYEIGILGKRGMTDGVIQIKYSSEKDVVPGRQHWSRMLSIPINVTVNSSIELGGCDMIPLQHDQCFTDDETNPALATYLAGLKAKGVLSDYCLLVIDLRNAWSQSIETSLWSSPDPDADVEKDRFTVTTVINAGRTTRLLVPVKRVHFSAEDLEKPIPNLSKRQFIVDSQSSPEQIRAVRETFWYRESLLKMLGGSWKVANGVERSGILELRGIRLSKKMINVLRFESVHINMSATSETQEISTNTSKGTDSTTFAVQAEQDFVTLSTVITNHTHHPFSGILRIIPSERYSSAASASSSSQDSAAAHSIHNQQRASAAALTSRWDNIENKIMYNGTLQQPVMDVKPGESVAVKLGVVFLSRGEYEWTSIVEETSSPSAAKAEGSHGRLRQHCQRDPIYVKAR